MNMFSLARYGLALNIREIGPDIRLAPYPYNMISAPPFDFSLIYSVI